MKISISIPSDLFCDTKADKSKLILESFGGEEALMEFVKRNFDSVEISMVSINMDPYYLNDAVKRFCERGLNVTIHGKLNEAKDGEDFFAPYMELLKENNLSLINITVHPLATKEETEDILSEICDYIDRNNYPVRITLENQRNKNEATSYAGCKGVCDIVSDVDSPNLYLCFDFGHQLSNVRKDLTPYDDVDDSFLSGVRHTHIHSYCDGITHFPLCMGETLLEENIIGLIKAGYDGYYNLELDPKRYFDKCDVRKTAEESISILKTAVYQCESKIKAEKEFKDYKRHIDNINERMDKSADGMGVLGPSAYIVKLGKEKIAIDPCLSLFNVDLNGRKALTDILNQCSAIIITHGHRDHFDPQLLSEVSDGVPVYFAHFVDFDGQNGVAVTDGDVINVDDIRITFFESAHSLGASIVPELGFCINYKNNNYVFPTDVRDYKKSHLTFDNTKILVAHLWLGKQNALNLYDNEYVEPFCNFVNSFGAENIYLSHLYDTHRKIDDMWSDVHCDYINDKIGKASVIRFGDWIEF